MDSGKVEVSVVRGKLGPLTVPAFSPQREAHFYIRQTIFYRVCFFVLPITKTSSPAQTMTARNRLLKELKALSETDPGVTIELTDNVHLLYAKITVDDNPLYKKAAFRVQISIPDEYPFVAPVCVFVKSSSTTVPVHPHIYSNGHICLDLLGPAWTPIHTIRSVLLSLQSFLASNTRLERPPDDESYCRVAPKNPTKTKFVYHDDGV